MAVKTTKQQFNQDCTFLGKVDFDQEVVLGNNGEVDGDLKVNGKIVDGDGNEKYLNLSDEPQTIADNKIIAVNALSEQDYNPGIIIESNGKNIQGFGLRVAQNINDHSSGCLIQTWRLVIDGKSLTPHDGGTIALISDIPAIYRHTIVIYCKGNGSVNDGVLCFTAYLKENQPIDSVQDLCTLCGNTDYQVSGYLFSGASQAVLKIHVGTTIEDSTATYVERTGLTTLKFSEIVVGEITDSVTTLVAPIATAKENLFPEEEEDEGKE